MRKSVDLALHNLLTWFYLIIFLPGLVWMTTNHILENSMSYGYFMVVTLIFVESYVLLSQVTRFILHEKWQERVNQFLEVLSIIIHI